jgi:hypothetical protein
MTTVAAWPRTVFSSLPNAVRPSSTMRVKSALGAEHVPVSGRATRPSGRRHTEAHDRARPPRRLSQQLVYVYDACIQYSPYDIYPSQWTRPACFGIRNCPCRDWEQRFHSPATSFRCSAAGGDRPRDETGRPAFRLSNKLCFPSPALLGQASAVSAVGDLLSALGHTRSETAYHALCDGDAIGQRAVAT